VSSTHEIAERRSAVRVDGPFQLQLRSHESDAVVNVASIADNVSRWGLYTRLLRRLDIGRALFGLVSLPSGSLVAARGRVIRLERLVGGGWGIAVHFSHARLLSHEMHDARDHVRGSGASNC
jgi:hypothetical protein